MKYSYAKETTDAVYLTVISHFQSRALKLTTKYQILIKVSFIGTFLAARMSVIERLYSEADQRMEEVYARGSMTPFRQHLQVAEVLDSGLVTEILSPSEFQMFAFSDFRLLLSVCRSHVWI